MPISYPVFIDSEYSNANHNGRADGLSKDVRTKNIIAFCERIKSCGYQAGVYASDSWFKSMVDFSKLKEYEIWCARYSDSAPTIPKYDIWQCGSQIVPGSSSAVDINKVYKKYSNNTKTPSSPEDNSYCYCRVNVKTSLNVRNKPSLSGKVVGHLTGDLAINVTTLDNGWCKISSDEQWCSYKYIVPTKGTVVNCNLLNFRSESNTSSKILKTLKCGEKLNILSKTGNWYYAEKMVSQGTFLVLILLQRKKGAEMSEIAELFTVNWTTWFITGFAILFALEKGIDLVGGLAAKLGFEFKFMRKNAKSMTCC